MRILLIGSAVAFALAGLCWSLERLFYGYVDADGVLQESFFLPLTFLFVFLGIALLVASLVKRTMR